MELTNYKIAYWPYRTDCKGPGDRRRFVFYCNEKKIDYHLASHKELYDIVYLTVGCNIFEWLQYKKKYPQVKIIFEVTDSYFLEGINIFSLFRGVTKFLNGRESKLYWDYNTAIKSMVKAAEAVVCSTPVQRDYLLQYNSNVHVSLDYFLDDITHVKKAYITGKKLKLVWEGQPYTVHNLLYINDVLKKLSDKIELHIITDPVIKYPFKIFNKSTASLLSSLKCEHYIHEWEKETFSKIISEMDIAIIPLNKNKYGSITMNKPENKLLLFWQIGIPVLTSNSQAYCRVMDKAGLPFYCNTKEEWIDKIEEFINLEEENRRQVIEKASKYINQYHSKEIIIQKWEKIFLSLFIDQP